MTKKTFRFTYPNYGTPDMHPDYTAHSGQRVTIVRQLIEGKEYDAEGGPMFEVQAADGWRGHACADELSPRPATLLEAEAARRLHAGGA